MSNIVLLLLIAMDELHQLYRIQAIIIFVHDDIEPSLAKMEEPSRELETVSHLKGGKQENHGLKKVPAE